MGITHLLLSFSVSMELIPKRTFHIIIIIFYKLISFVILEQIEIRIDIMIIILFKLDWKYIFLVLNLLNWQIKM
jgi:hypothetical protein